MENLDGRLSRYLSLSPLLIALLVGLGGPLLFFSLNYKYQQAEVETVSKIHGSLVNDTINKNPSMWQFEENKLLGILEDRSHRDTEEGTLSLRIVLTDGTVLASQGGAQPPPKLLYKTPLFDASEEVGYFVAEASLRGALINTLWVTIVCILVSGFIIYALRTVPLRAIRDSYRRLDYLANYDALTGLANRNCFMVQLELALAQARRAETSVLLMFIDLDNFKVINDSMGHDIGDEVLSTLGKRMSKLTRRSDCSARLGGDEFVLCFTQLDGNIAAINRLVSRVRKQITKPIVLAQRHIKMTASIGLAKFPDDGVDGSSLLKAADLAMYESKSRGKNSFSFYSRKLSLILQERQKIIEGLPTALENQEFHLLYQTLVAAKTLQIVGVEALIRWRHRELGDVRPDRFISIAEETGDIVQIGGWVLQQACKQAKIWQTIGHDPVCVAVNVSPVQFTHPGFLESIDDALAAASLAPEHLELEITESLIMADFDTAYDVMLAIQSRGISLSIDDFGTGYSSLSHLKRFPVSKLKIDKSFITGLHDSGEDQLITKIIIMLAKELNLQVVAEGVENAEQLAFLRDNHCDILQGYYFSRPVSPELVFEVAAY